MSTSSDSAKRGAASVEYIALAGVVGALIAVAIAALVASPPKRADRELGEMLARRIACTPPLSRALRAQSARPRLRLPARQAGPEPRPRPGGQDLGELPVDFRYCRRASCARPGSDAGLTSSGRRVTEFTSVED